MTKRDRPSATPPAAYGVIEHDLANTASERVSTAIYSMLQLADDPQTKFIIAAHAMSTAIGITARVYQVLDNAPEADPYELAKTILDLARTTASAEKEQSACP